MPDNTLPLRAIFVSLRQAKIEHIERLIKLKEAGVAIGAPTLEDILAREQKSIENLTQAIENLDKLTAS